jgi:hypothetical protein
MIKIEINRGTRRMRYFLLICLGLFFQKARMLQIIPTAKKMVPVFQSGIVKIGMKNSQLVEINSRPSHSNRFTSIPPLP